MNRQRHTSSLLEIHHRSSSKTITLLALVLTVIIHWGAYTIIPWKIKKTPLIQREEISVTYQQPAEDTKKRFIETNPDLPSNEPDTADAFAARSQQASQAQKIESQLKKNPFIEGESDTSHKVSSGDLSSKELPAETFAPNTSYKNQPNAPSPPLATPATTKAQLAQNKPLQKEGIISLTQANQNKQTIPSKIIPLDPISAAKINETIDNAQTPAQPLPPTTQKVQQPRPRPRVAPDVLYGKTLKSKGNIIPAQGNALNAKFNEFGDYLQQIYEIVGLQWYALNRNTNAIRDEVASTVIVEFSINREGQVTYLAVKQSTASSVATIICQDAIRARAPFGPWTEEMIATLNEEETIIFQFNYY